MEEFILFSVQFFACMEMATRANNAELLQQKQPSPIRRLFSPASWTLFKEGTSEMQRLGRSLFGAETWTLRKLD
jgi:hypothetical protein